MPTDGNMSRLCCNQTITSIFNGCHGLPAAPCNMNGTWRAKKETAQPPRSAAGHRRTQAGLIAIAPGQLYLARHVATTSLSIWRPPPDTYACATRSKGRSSLAPFGGQPGGEPKEVGKKERCYSVINQHGSFRR